MTTYDLEFFIAEKWVFFESFTSYEALLEKLNEEVNVMDYRITCVERRVIFDTLNS